MQLNSTHTVFSFPQSILFLYCWTQIHFFLLVSIPISNAMLGVVYNKLEHVLAIKLFPVIQEHLEYITKEKQCLILLPDHPLFIPVTCYADFATVNSLYYNDEHSVLPTQEVYPSTLVTGYSIHSHYFICNFLKVLFELNNKVNIPVDACFLLNHVLKIKLIYYLT